MRDGLSFFSHMSTIEISALFFGGVSMDNASLPWCIVRPHTGVHCFLSGLSLGYLQPPPPTLDMESALSLSRASACSLPALCPRTLSLITPSPIFEASITHPPPLARLSFPPPLSSCPDASTPPRPSGVAPTRTPLQPRYPPLLLGPWPFPTPTALPFLPFRAPAVAAARQAGRPTGPRRRRAEWGGRTGWRKGGRSRWRRERGFLLPRQYRPGFLLPHRRHTWPPPRDQPPGSPTLPATPPTSPPSLPPSPVRPPGCRRRQRQEGGRGWRRGEGRRCP